MGTVVGIVNIGLGNVDSVRRAIQYLGIDYQICDRPSELESVHRIIFPGVGNFGAAASILEASQFGAAIRHQVHKNKKPTLGICLGMQLLSDYGSEGGGSHGLGLVTGSVELHRGVSAGVSIPHIGWNDVHHQGGMLYKGIKSGTCFYFVHSYELLLESNLPYVATANHGIDFVASFEEGHLFGVQFHPEKSQEMGLHMLKNFAEYEYA